MTRNDRGGMKRSTRALEARALLLLVALSGLLALAGCGSGVVTPAGAGAREAGERAHHGAGADEALVTPGEYSIYHLDAVWTDQHGVQRTLGTLGGRVQVVALVYTYCAHACPRILGDMMRIEAGLTPEERERVGFVLVSIDPERDTPERLLAFAGGVGLDPERWTLLTAPDATALELAALLGVKYRRVGENDFAHTNVITILDQSGVVANRQVGLGGEPTGSVATIRRLLAAGGQR